MSLGGGSRHTYRERRRATAVARAQRLHGAAQGDARAEDIHERAHGKLIKKVRYYCDVLLRE